MKVIFFIDACSNAIDNRYQRDVVFRLAHLTSRNHAVQIVDTEILGKDNALKIMLDQEYDAYFTYNRTGTDIIINDSNGCEINLMSTISRMNYSWLTEHPLCWYENYYNSQKNRHYITPSKSHLFFMEEMDLIGNKTIQLFGSDTRNNLKDHKDRKYDVCIAAQWRGSEKANEFWTNFHPESQKFFTTILNIQDNDVDKDTFNAYIKSAAVYDINLSDKKLHAQFMRGIYWHARKKERINLVKNFVDSGLKIALVGGVSWKEVLNDTSNVDFYPEADHNELINIYGNSKSVVNLNAANGACERAFDGASCNSMIITEYSSLMNSIFTNNDAALNYLPSAPKQTIELLKEILKSGYSQKISNNGHQIFLNNHTWDHRASFLSDLLNNYQTGELK